MGAIRAPSRLDPADVDGGVRAGASERLYASLLRLYPVAFRERYGAQMLVLFTDQLRDARAGRASGGAAGIWIKSLIDLASSAVGEHLRKERTVAQSMAAFEPTRSMRLLGLFGLVGAGLLLAAFVSFNPFSDPTVNRVRLVAFALAGAAISIAFYRRQALAAPTLARLTTAAVVIAGAWNATWVILSAGVANPFIGTFGFVSLLANIALWVSTAIWAIAMLHTGAVWQGMPRWLGLGTRVGLWLLIGSIVGWLGDDRLGLVDSLWGEMWQAVALAGVAMNGLGWALLGVVLLVSGRAR